MKTFRRSFLALALTVVFLSMPACQVLAQTFTTLPHFPAKAPDAAADNSSKTIPWDQIGAKADADYQGGGLTVTPADEGARLHCVFQRLNGDATREGLWLTSTVPGTSNDRFRVTAIAVETVTAEATAKVPQPAPGIQLPRAGDITLDGQLVRFSRPGLTEEYSASVDGVQQDFVVAEKPAGAGELQVRLEVAGASVKTMPGGARLVLEKSGRQIAYSRLRATDANGRELPAKIEVLSPNQLAVAVDDTMAQYPVRIDPTFSDANWVSFGGLPGANGAVFAIAVDASGNVYIGGNFTQAGNTNANNIAEWNGTGWLPLGSGVNAIVDALAISGGTLYAGGSFTTAGGAAANDIAQWNGGSWSALGSGMNNTVLALAVSGGTVYAGGEFTEAGIDPVGYIAQWNGANWSPMGAGMSSEVAALAVIGTNLYAGGDFDIAGSNVALYIAKWNGSNNWQAVGGGMNGGVAALAVSGTNLFAGGSFTTAGGAAANDIAQWNGTVWSALGKGFNSDVRAVAASGTNVFAAGDFTTATNSGGGAVTAHYVAHWNGTSWSALGVGAGNGGFAQTFALATSGTNVYLGGAFTAVSPAVGVVAADNIAQWNNSTWLPMGSGINSAVSAVAIAGNTLYVGGGFLVADPASFLAQWTGTNWAAVGSGVNSTVEALAAYGTNLIAGGFFTTAGGVNATNIAEWNGNTWSALGLGMASSFGPGFSTVNALMMSGTNLIAGGMFTTAGGVNATNVALWNGHTWAPLGTGVGNNFSQVSALAMWGTNLDAGGFFQNAGATTVNNIAQWNGNTWSALGLGFNSGVNALAAYGTNLVAGGGFTIATNSGNIAVTVDRIAQWNGSSWSPLGVGLNNNVNALAVSGNYLYAGGSFTVATNTGNVTVSVNDLAQWDGSNWSAVGQGMNGAVSALAISGTNMLVGGSFTTADGVVSAYAAEAIAQTLPPQPELSISLDEEGNAIVTWPDNYVGYTLLYTFDLTTPQPWPAFPIEPTDVNGQWTVTVPLFISPQAFFVLEQ